MKKANISPIITLQGALLAKFYEDSLAMHLKNENNIHLTLLTIPSSPAMQRTAAPFIPRCTPFYIVQTCANQPWFRHSTPYIYTTSRAQRKPETKLMMHPCFLSKLLACASQPIMRHARSAPNPILGKCPALLTKSQKYTHNSKQY